MCILILNEDQQLVHCIDIGITYHDERRYQFELNSPNEILESLQPHWTIGIWAISAPYPGYECVVKDSELTILASFRWNRRKHWLLFLYQNGYCYLTSQEEQQEQEEQSTRLSHPVRLRRARKKSRI